ncbi:MAG: copper resistance protein B [Rhodospirillales bacterium]
MKSVIDTGPLKRFFIAAVAAALIFSGTARADVMDTMVSTFFEVERLEYRVNDGRNSLNWEAQGWAGTDGHKLWFKTEGGRHSNGSFEDAEVQLLYSRMISDFWDAQAGLRYDIQPEPRRGFFVLGLQGLAKQFIEVDTALFVSDDGDVSARFEAEYELLLTQKFIAQASFETNVAAQKVRRLGIGSGINDIEVGLRLRYEIVREFAPYIGVQWERKLGRTADFAREEGEDIDTLAFVAGIRFWF